MDLSFSRYTQLWNSFLSLSKSLQNLYLKNLRVLQMTGGRDSLETRRRKQQVLLTWYQTELQTLRQQVLSGYTFLQTQTNSRKKGLCVGINYVSTQNELQGCMNDALSCQKFLQQNGCTQITLLTDDTVLRPTSATIVDQLRNLFINCVEGDSLFFSFSGHGSYVPDIDGDEDPQIGYDECLYTVDGQFLVDDDLRGLIRTNQKPNTTLFVLADSCFSGSVLDLRYQYLDSLHNNRLTTNLSYTETVGDVFFISGCTDTQTSADAYIGGQYQGAMTYAFLRSFRNGITWRQLLRQMRDWLSRNGYTQIPQLSSGRALNIDTPMYFSLPPLPSFST